MLPAFHLSTYLLFNDEARRSIEAEADSRSDPVQNPRKARFSHDFGNYRVSNPRFPEWATVIDEVWVLDCYPRCGLRVTVPVRYGNWSGRKDGSDVQDVIVAGRA
jgi:hypothetical protein